MGRPKKPPLEDVKLTGNTVKDIQIMLPYLGRREKDIMLGMCLAKIGPGAMVRKRKVVKTDGVSKTSNELVRTYPDGNIGIIPEKCLRQ